jgi:hypothetical protein
LLLALLLWAELGLVPELAVTVEPRLPCERGRLEEELPPLLLLLLDGVAARAWLLLDGAAEPEWLGFLATAAEWDGIVVAGCFEPELDGEFLVVVCLLKRRCTVVGVAVVSGSSECDFYRAFGRRMWPSEGP